MMETRSVEVAPRQTRLIPLADECEIYWQMSDLLADEREAIYGDTEAFLQKHLDVMTPHNQSGLSLRRLVSLQITIVKFKD